MAGIVFYFEENDIDVWSGRKMDLDAWNYNCKIGNINDVIIVNKSSINIQPFDRGMNIKIVDELPNLNGHVTQLVTNTEMKKYKKSYSELWDFDHKTDWYVFGPANGWVGKYFANTLYPIFCICQVCFI